MFHSLLSLIDLVVNLYIFVVIVRVLLSWIPHNHNHSIIRLIYEITEPPLSWIRQRLPNFAGLDISPMILIIAIIILRKIIFSILW